MNPVAIRAALSALNFLGVLLVSWVTYQTFFVVDQSTYLVEAPDLERVYIRPTPVNTGSLQLSRYAPIWQIFEPPPPPPAPAPAQPATPATPPPPPITVVAFIIDQGSPPDPSLHSVILRITGGSQPSTRVFRVGDALDGGTGWERYRQWTVREVRERPGEPGSRPTYEALIDTPNGTQVLVQEQGTGG